CARQADRMGGFPERIGGSDYLLPWANPKGQEGNQETHRAARHSDRVFPPKILRERSLEGFGGRSSRNPRGPQYSIDRFKLGRRNIRIRKRNKRIVCFLGYHIVEIVDLHNILANHGTALRRARTTPVARAGSEV